MASIFSSIEENTVYRRTEFIIKYIVALLIPLLLFSVLEIPFLSFFKSSASIIYMAGVILSAWYGGFRAGTLTTLLSIFFVNYFYTYPYGWEVFLQVNGASKFFMFTAEGTLISYVLDKVSRRKEIAVYKEQIKDLKGKMADLYEANAELKKEIRSRDEFLSIASHELKTPLTSMLLQTQHALHNIRNVSLAHFSIESLLKMLESVENQTRRLSKMINDFLNISVITTGNLQLEYSEVDLNTAVQNVIAEFSPRIEEDKYVLTVTQQDQITGMWDKTRVEQVISNIISNALKYGSGKPIDVTVRLYEGKAQILVKDHGIGVPKNMQKRVFELFERGVSAEKYKGLGVGLYITREIVRAHKGNLHFTSKPNRGTMFIIELPLDPQKE